MVALSSNDGFVNVTRVETTDVALGGNETNVPNKQFVELASRDQFLRDVQDELLVTAAGGLDVSYSAGAVILEDRTRAVIAADTLTLADNATTVIFVGDGGTIQTGSEFPSRCCPIAEVTTSGGSVTGLVDLRPRFQVVPSAETALSLGSGGGEGAKVFSSNETLDKGEYYYESMVVNSGVTVTISRFALIRVKGDVTINGNITVTPAVQGASSFGTAATAANLGGGGGAGPGFGSASGAGSPYNFSLAPHGSGGGAGFIVNELGGSPAGTVASGGNGGGGMIVESGGSITVASTSTISANGANGGIGVATAAVPTLSGGGGGSGGLLLFKAAKSVTFASGATLQVIGGNGGNGVTGNASGGGGGGGGQVVIIAPTSSTSGSTVTLTGGTAGANNGTGATGGGSGGGFGGAGGTAGSGGPNNGSVGQLIVRNFVPA